ncbi:MAG: class I tRNA ligase family protein, partial [Nanoarchaeota archaeon]
NNEKVPVYAGNFVLADYGSGMVMAVPAHDQRDFEFAKKYGIPIKLVVQPLIVKEDGEDAVKENLPFKKRNAVVCVVKHWSEDKYLCLKWKQVNWKGFVIGGIEEGEDTVDAAKREILEETGYKKAKFVKKLGDIVNSQFYHKLKKENRWAFFQGLYFELENGSKEDISEDEKKIHDVLWMKKEEVEAFLNVEDMKLIWRRAINKEGAYTGPGILVNSEGFNDLDTEEAKEHIVKALEIKKLGKKTIQYKLRDWLISRQRYWGTPIPIVYCDKCGIVPVNEKDLPIKLPDKVKFGEGNPLATNKDFVNTKCPKCNGKARRETDTMDTFVNSSWYYLRYTDPKNSKKIFDEKKVSYWCPIDQYIGGPEHITMHLIYIRFYAKFLRDLGLIKFDEPALRYFTQGIVHGSDGEKMSKSKPETLVEPLEMIEKYGADTLRLALVSFASPDNDSNWDEKIVLGSHKFLNKIFEYFSKNKFGKSDVRIESKINKAIKEITIDIENFKHNLAAIKLRMLFDYFQDKDIDKKTAEKFIILLSVYCPFISEELWEKIGGKGFVSLASWPIVDEKKIDLNLEKEEEALDKTVSDVFNILKIIKEKKGKEADKIYLYVIPPEKANYNEDTLTKRIGKDVKVYVVNDKHKYDPENKAGKAKPGRPAVYLE